MFVCVCGRVCVDSWVWVRVWVRVYGCVCRSCVCMCAYFGARVCVCGFVYGCVCMGSCVSARVNVWVHVLARMGACVGGTLCMCIYVYICVCARAYDRERERVSE